MTVIVIAIVAGDSINYQSFVYGSCIWQIQMRYNNIKYQSLVYGIFVWEAHVRDNMKYQSFFYGSFVSLREIQVRY